MFNFCLFGVLLTTVAASANPFQAFNYSDACGKAVVLMLFGGSIYTWTIMIEKGVYLRRALETTKCFKELFRSKKYPLAIYREGLTNSSPLAELYRRATNEMLTYYSMSPDSAPYYGSPNHPGKKLTTAQLETIRSVMERAVADKILEIEDRMLMLATAVSVSPFVGLFGTVWGVMMAFVGIAQEGRADIGSMAPGIAGALIATVAGLIVAIPSLIGYNLLSNSIRELTVYMDNFVEEFMAKIKL